LGLFCVAERVGEKSRSPKGGVGERCALREANGAV